MSQYTLTVPNDVFRRARKLAEQTQQSVDRIMIEHLRTLPPLPPLSDDEEAELEALVHLSNDALWTIAREQMDIENQTHLQSLMDKNSLGTIVDEEEGELRELVERGERLMLRKSAAAALLTERGYTVSPETLSTATYPLMTPFG